MRVVITVLDGTNILKVKPPPNRTAKFAAEEEAIMVLWDANPARKSKSMPEGKRASESA